MIPWTNSPDPATFPRPEALENISDNVLIEPQPKVVALKLVKVGPALDLRSGRLELSLRLFQRIQMTADRRFPFFRGKVREEKKAGQKRYSSAFPNEKEP